MLKSVVRITILLVLIIGISITSFGYGLDRGYKLGILESNTYVELNKSTYLLDKQISRMVLYKLDTKEGYEKSNEDDLKHYLSMYKLSKEVDSPNNKSFFDKVLLEESIKTYKYFFSDEQRVKEKIKSYLETTYTKEEIENIIEFKEFFENY